MRQIKQATRHDQKKIEALRISEFSRSADFTLLKPEKLLWSQTDDDSIVLLILNEHGIALSTMRGVTAPDCAAAEKILKCSVPETVKFPVTIFTSAATLKPFRRRGFNQLLRLYFLKYARCNNIQTLISPVYKNAPRIKFMKKLGYKFITPETNWQKKLDPKSERQLGLLTATKIERAISVIEQCNAKLIHAYPWQGEEITSEEISSKKISSKKISSEEISSEEISCSGYTPSR